MRGLRVYSSYVLVESFQRGQRSPRPRRRRPGRRGGRARARRTSSATASARSAELVDDRERRSAPRRRPREGADADRDRSSGRAPARSSPGTRSTRCSEPGEVFVLRSTGNLSTGGTAVDKTDVIHPDNAEIAARAAKVIGLDVAGIDLICQDISNSVREHGGVIVEVNAAPASACTSRRPRARRATSPAR